MDHSEPPSDLRLTRFLLGGCELLVLEHALTEVDPRLASLTRAQRATLELALAGLSNHEIAARRRLASATVAKHLATAYRKLGVSTRAEAAVMLGANPPAAR